MAELVGYTEETKQQLKSLNEQLQEYISENFQRGKDGAGYWTISHKGNRQPADKSETEAHQRYIRSLKQDMINVSQNSLYEYFNSGIGAIPQGPVEREYYKIFPLVMRRKNMIFVAQTILKNMHTAPFTMDGELFSFNEPIDIKVDNLFCDCGQFPLSLEQMMEHEIQLATEHLKVCQHIRVVKTTEKSVISKHTVGHWDCRACYKEPAKMSDTYTTHHEATYSEVESTEWCPRFLRPFRTNTPQQYASILRLDRQEQKSCYGGILHKQISVEQDGDKSFVVREERCDTCGYSNTDKKELLTTQPSQTTELAGWPTGTANSRRPKLDGEWMTPNKSEPIKLGKSIKTTHFSEFANWPIQAISGTEEFSQEEISKRYDKMLNARYTQDFSVFPEPPTTKEQEKAVRDNRRNVKTIDFSKDVF